MCLSHLQLVSAWSEVRVLTRLRHSFPCLQTMALGPSGAPTVSLSKSNSDLRKVCCGCDLTVEQLLHVQLSMQTKILEFLFVARGRGVSHQVTRKSNVCSQLPVGMRVPGTTRSCLQVQTKM